MLVEILLFLAALCYLFYRKVTRNKDYWKDKNIPYIPKSMPLGIDADLFLKRKNFMEKFRENYEILGRPKYFGMFLFGSPLMVINDPENIRNILVKDFDNFVNRNGENTKNLFKPITEIDKVWFKQLTTLEGNEWKDVRSTFSPIFTSGKMKGMMPLIEKVCDDLLTSLKIFSDKEEAFDLKDQLGRYSMDSIAACAFGIDANSFKDNDSQFAKSAKAIFGFDFWDGMRLFGAMIPGVKQLMMAKNVGITKTNETKFFYDVVKSAIEMRKTSKERRNDLIDLMIDAMKDDSNKDIDEDDEQFDKDSKLNHKKKSDLDETVVVATAMVMLVAGYDTTASTISFIAYELALNPKVQDKLIEEIDENFEEGKRPDYLTVQNLEYLDMVVCETQRFHTLAGILGRGVEQEYKVPGTDYTLEAGMDVMVNGIGLHFDPEYYSTPDQFNPDHFSKENKSKRPTYAFMPFGHGPRACIGMRFALLEVKLALVAILRKYRIVSCSETPPSVTMDPNSQLGNPIEKLMVKIVPRS